MKKTFIAVAALALFVLASCGGSSKGNWSEDDKAKAQEAVEEVKADLEVMLGEKAEDYINCYLEKVENEYDNFEAADSDREGCEKLAKECMEDLM